MNKQGWLVLAVCVVSMAAAAFLLSTQHTRQKLGKPGVKVVDVPVYGQGEKITGTNKVFLAGSKSVFLPPQVLDYESVVTPVSKIVWDWLPKDTTFGQRNYRARDGFWIQNLVVLMGADRTSIHQPQYCLTGSGWHIDSQEKVTISITRPVRYELPAMKLTTTKPVKDPGGQTHVLRGIFVYWFVADNELTDDHRERMWWMARDLIRTGVLQRWAYVTYFSVCGTGQEEATFNRLKRFISASVPEFQLVSGPPIQTVASGE